LKRRSYHDVGTRWVGFGWAGPCTFLGKSPHPHAIHLPPTSLALPPPRPLPPRPTLPEEGVGAALCAGHRGGKEGWRGWARGRGGVGKPNCVRRRTENRAAARKGRTRRVRRL